jgi:O-acetyl-ADP-ribose deacetylase (regulator of RNase III)
MNGELDHAVDHQSASACDTMTETGFSIKYFLVNGSVTVILDKDDITQMKVDAVVNPTNSKLKGIKSVGTLLEEKAGPDYIADCKRRKDAVGGFQIGDVQETCAGKLPCKFVLQAVIPRWTKDERKQEEYAGDLETTFYNVFKKAKQLKLDSVACPVLSRGKYKICKWYNEKYLSHPVQYPLHFYQQVADVVFYCSRYIWHSMSYYGKNGVQCTFEYS